MNAERQAVIKARTDRIQEVMKTATHDQQVEVAAIFAEDNLNMLDAFLDDKPWDYEKTVAEAEKVLKIDS